MPGLLTRALNWAFAPGGRRPARQPFRLSQAEAERGRYDTEFPGWTPLSIPGDPPIGTTLPHKQARPLFDALVASSATRADAAREVLTTLGHLAPMDDLMDPLTWELLERRLAQMAGDAAPEDALDPYPRRRPTWHAFLLDVGALAFVTARQVPGWDVSYGTYGLNPTPDRSTPMRAFPVLWRADRLFVSPYEGALFQGPSRTFATLADPPPVIDRETELHEAFDALIVEYGAPRNADDRLTFLEEALREVDGDHCRPPPDSVARRMADP